MVTAAARAFIESAMLIRVAVIWTVPGVAVWLGFVVPTGECFEWTISMPNYWSYLIFAGTPGRVFLSG